MSGYTPALTKLVALRKTARGRLVGESNPRVRHSDETVALACRLHESGMGSRISVSHLAALLNQLFKAGLERGAALPSKTR